MKKKLLLDIGNSEDTQKILTLLNVLEEEGFSPFILRSQYSEECLPFCVWEKYFKDGNDFFDLKIVFDGEGNGGLSLLKENLQHPERVVSQVNLHFRGENLTGYGFLVTMGAFYEPFGESHFIGAYGYEALYNELIKQIAMEGGMVSVICSQGTEVSPYANYITIVNDKEEYLSVLASRGIKNDVIYDGMAIPRFGLSAEERIKVEYQKYYAELSETYLPFKDEASITENQLIAHFIRGTGEVRDSITYYFDNTPINMIIYMERNSTYAKAFFADGSFKVLSYSNLAELAKGIINESLMKLERW